MTRCRLEVESSNTTAIRSIGDLPEYYGAGKSGLHMMHEIPAGQPAATTRAD